jgi:hypothetical protein
MTYCLEGSCSIQLSYRTENFVYKPEFLNLPAFQGGRKAKKIWPWRQTCRLKWINLACGRGLMEIHMREEDFSAEYMFNPKRESPKSIRIAISSAGASLPRRILNFVYSIYWVVRRGDSRQLGSYESKSMGLKRENEIKSWKSSRRIQLLIGTNE